MYLWAKMKLPQQRTAKLSLQISQSLTLIPLIKNVTWFYMTYKITNLIEAFL